MSGVAAAIRRGPNGIRPPTGVLGGYPCDPISPIRPGCPAEVRLQGLMARIALRSPIPLPPADATRGVGRFLYGDARVRHTLAMLSLAPGPGPGGGGGVGDEPLLRATGRHRALRAAFFISSNQSDISAKIQFSKVIYLRR